MLYRTSLLLLGILGLCVFLPNAKGLDASPEQQTQETLKKILATQTPRPAPAQIAWYEGGSGDDGQVAKKGYIYQIQANCKADERQYLEMQGDLIYPWKQAWMAGDANAFLRLLETSAEIPDLTHTKPEPFRKLGAITEAKWPAVMASVRGRSRLSALKKYLGQFSHIEAIELATTQVKADVKDRNADMSIRQARLSLRADIRGFDHAHIRREDRGNLEVTVAQTNDHRWQITGVRALNFQSLTNTKPSFVDATQASLGDQIPTYLRTEAIRRGGYALAFGDYDGDGNLDMYVGARGAGTLLRGDGKGGFKVVKDSGLGDDTLVKTAIFADFSNSGRQDLLLVRFTPLDEKGKKAMSPTMRNDLVLYRNLGDGKFKRDDSISNGAPSDYAMPAAVADFNHDGFLDFYVGFPGAKDFTTLTDPAGAPADVQVQGLFLSHNGKSFAMVDRPELNAAAYDKVSHRQKIFPHAAIAVDFNQDGNTDIIVMDDRGNISPAYQNRGDGTFFQVAENIGVANDAFGMGIAAADFDNDGRLDLMMSNVNFLASRRLNNSCRTNWGQVFAPQWEKSQDLRLFKGMGDGKFSEVTSAAGLEWAGEGLAGVEFIDYNNDGLMDIYVTNGLWTGTDERQDISSLFASERQNLITNRVTLGRPHGTIMDILRYFKGDIKTGELGVARPEMAGHQRKRLFRNDGNGHFTEVGFLEGVDSVADGYMVAKADINNDGVQDLILRNADPGSDDVHFPPVQIFLNQNPSHNNVLRLTLEGVKSNRDGIGSEVSVEGNGMKQLQQVIANNGTVQSERTLSFGLGAAAQADKVTIRWPSGIVQVLTDVAAGPHKIREQESSRVTYLSPFRNPSR